MEVGHRRSIEASEVLASFDRALPQVYDYVLYRCRNKAVAEDLTSETFLAAVRDVGRSTPEAISVAWLIGIARHKLIDHWRRQEREERRLSMVGVAPEIDTTLDEVEPGRGMAVLDGMNAMQSAALTLRHVDGLSVPDVAAALGRSIPATETLLSRGRSTFRIRYLELLEAHDD